MWTHMEILQKLSAVFDPRQATVLAEIIAEARDELVRARDFNELKGIVRELAEAQKRTEQRVEELAEAQKRTEQRVEELAEAQKRTEQRVEELAEAQKRTEQRVEELAEAQKRTEQRVEELAEAQRRSEERISRLEAAVQELAEAQKRTEQRMEELAKAVAETQRRIQELTHQMGEMRRELGGLGRSMAYALENEAYRMLPAFLAERYGIHVTERFVRTYIGDEEINLFGRGQRDGQEVLIVGEVKVRAEKGRREDPLEQLEQKVEVVREAYPGEEMVLLLVTHHAHPDILRQAQERGVIVVQSFEW